MRSNKQAFDFDADAWQRRVGKDLPDVLAEGALVSRSDVLALGSQ